MKATQRKKRRPTIHREDTVMVISGKDKGRTGRVITVDCKRSRFQSTVITRPVRPLSFPEITITVSSRRIVALLFLRCLAFMNQTTIILQVQVTGFA